MVLGVNFVCFLQEKRIPLTYAVASGFALWGAPYMLFGQRNIPKFLLVLILGALCFILSPSEAISWLFIIASLVALFFVGNPLQENI